MPSKKHRAIKIANMQEKRRLKRHAMHTVDGRVSAKYLNKLIRAKIIEMDSHSIYDNGISFMVKGIGQCSLFKGYLSLDCVRQYMGAHNLSSLSDIPYRYKIFSYRGGAILWDSIDALMSDLSTDAWVNCTVVEENGLFPTMTREKVVNRLMADESLREMPVELIDIISRYVVE